VEREAELSVALGGEAKVATAASVKAETLAVEEAKGAVAEAVTAAALASAKEVAMKVGMAAVVVEVTAVFPVMEAMREVVQAPAMEAVARELAEAAAMATAV